MLLDLGLPDLGGHEVLARLRETSSVPVILVTARAEELDKLTGLASDPGRVFSRAQLLASVWGYDFYGDERVVDVHIRRIRAALGDDAANPRRIGTVRGVGYRLLEATPCG